MAFSSRHADSVASAPTERQILAARFRAVRAITQQLTQGLTPEDQVVQSMSDASPTKWHLAHTSWFFETFLLAPKLPRYQPFHPEFGYLFNSYYVMVGPRHPRPSRGMLTRPPLDEVLRYRAHVDDAMEALVARADEDVWTAVAPLFELGLNHEQQHQELILTDLLHALSCNPLRPAYRPFQPTPGIPARAVDWIAFDEGIHEVGHDGEGFAFDNEGPRHRILLQPFRLASRPVSNAEWQAFIADDGYRRPELWLSDGWAMVEAEGWQAPLYWERRDDGAWRTMTLSGMRRIDDEAPVCHISYYEADAFARWTGKRLPRETEWEIAAASLPAVGNMLGSGLLRPVATDTGGDAQQMFGDVWEWTQSPYVPYPRFRASRGAVGEYNGKFMCNQLVLRGGSCITPDGHVRATYRNFFYPFQRWQFSGLRLAEDL